jgi:putative hydrolase of the HAD superfamily
MRSLQEGKNVAITNWIIFDADNTLWDVETIYDEARAQFCRFALETITNAGENKGEHVTRDLLEQAQRQRDIQLHKTHGYSSSRFARSFEDTFSFFMPYVRPEDLVHVRRIALDVFEQRATPVAGLEETLGALVGKYRLAIITAGERWVQEKRLREFHLRDNFSQLLIVERKSAEVFADFCKAHSVCLDGSWVVGDSIRSDVVPALAAGLKAVHIRNANWAVEHEETPAGAVSVTSIKELLAVLPIST